MSKVNLYKIIKNDLTGFTLVEIIVSLSMFLVAILLTSSIYLLTQKSYNQGAAKAELSQNARVTLDRLSRELRQAVTVVTAIPAASSSPAVEIFFQDGHDISQITYLRYYLSGSDLKRQHKAYYFSAEPATYVPWNSVDVNGNPPQEKIISDEIVGEKFSSLGFWGSTSQINIQMGLIKGQSRLNLETSIYKRN